MSAEHTGTCPACNRRVGFAANGRLARHNYPYNRGVKCAGSGSAAREHARPVVPTAAERRLAREMFG